jgi:hypothetical protein
MKNSIGTILLSSFCRTRFASAAVTSAPLFLLYASYVSSRSDEAALERGGEFWITSESLSSADFVIFAQMYVQDVTRTTEEPVCKSEDRRYRPRLSVYLTNGVSKLSEAYSLDCRVPILSHPCYRKNHESGEAERLKATRMTEGAAFRAHFY